MNFETDKTKEKILLPALTGILILSVVLSGGISWQDCIVPCTLMIAAIIIFNKGLSLRNSVFVIILMGCAGVSVLAGIGNMQNAIYEAEKTLCFLLAYIIGTEIKDDLIVAKTIFWTCVITASTGLLAYCKIIYFNEFIFEDYSLMRLQSFVKYANVTASLLGCGYVAFLEIYRNEEKKWYVCLGTIIIIALYLTFSKAFIPIFMIISTIYLFKHKEMTSVWLLHNIIAIIIAGLVVVAKPNNILLLVLIIAGVFISRKSYNLKNAFRIWIILMCTALVCGTVLVILKPSILQTFNVRLNYMYNAFKMFEVNVLTGTGPGSWETLQYAFQNTDYSVAYIHNGILQLLVENGIFFTLTFVVMVCMAIIRAVNLKKYWLLCTVLYIIVHSLLDCELSFASILILLGFVMGTTDANIEKEKQNYKLTEKIISIVLVGCFIIVNVYMISEYTIRSDFEKTYLDGNIKDAREKAKKLERLCPNDARLKITLAALEEENGGSSEKIEEYLQEAVDLSKYDAHIYESYMLYNIDKDNIEEMCMYYINLAPKQEKTYIAAKNYIQLAKKNGYISSDRMNEIIEKINDRRIKEKVKDRNEILNELINK